MSKHKRLPQERAFEARLQQLSKQELVALFDTLRRRRKISFVDIEQIHSERGASVPVSIFNPVLSSFESICVYLKERKGLSYHEIAVLLKRDDRTIWTVYHHALRKQKITFSLKRHDITIPLSIFQERKLSILEHLTAYLKEYHSLSYHEIAVLLKRDDRTIWTVYQRALKKRIRR